MYKEDIGMYAFKVCVLGALVLLGVSACGSRGGDAERDDAGFHSDAGHAPPPSFEFDFAALEFEDAGHARRLQGFEVSAASGGRTYFFTTREAQMDWAFPVFAQSHNAQAIRSVEEMIWAIEGMADLSVPPLAPPLRVFWVDDADQYDLFITRGEVAINFDDINTFGWLAHRWSGRRLPMWLSAGLEMVARAGQGSFRPADVPDGFLLCDTVFARPNWGSPAQAHGVAAAYHFVRHLRETGQLAEIVSLYMTGGAGDAARADALAFAAHGGGSFGFGFSAAFRLYYPGGDLIAAHAAPTVALRSAADGDDIHLLFFYEPGYFLEQGSFGDYLETVRRTFADVSGWFEEHLPMAGIRGFEREPVSATLRFFPPGETVFQAGHAGASSMLFNVTSTDWLDFQLASNAVSMMGQRARALDLSFVSWEDSAPLWTGFDAALSNVFALRLSRRDAVFGWLQPLWSGDMDPGAFSEDEIFAAFSEASSALGIGMDHLLAYVQVFHFDWLVDEHFIDWPEARETFYGIMDAFGAWDGPAFPGVDTANKSMSFVLYLLQEHGSEKYIQLHVDPSRLEELYGMTAAEMTGSWQRFLEETAESLRGALRGE